MSDPHVPKVFEDANMDDPKQHFAPGISQWPAVGKMAPMPSVKQLVPDHSEHLYDMGYRWHPELQTKFKIVDAKTGLGRFVDKAEYEKHVAGKPASKEDEALSMLRDFNPDLADNLANLSPSERNERAKEMEGSAQAAIDMLMKLRKDLNWGEVYGSGDTER